jgi:hypothetical protein
MKTGIFDKNLHALDNIFQLHKCSEYHFENLQPGSGYPHESAYMPSPLELCVSTSILKCRCEH